MTLALAIVGLSLVLENKDLLIFALSLDFARYLGTFDAGVPILTSASLTTVRT